MQTRMRKTIEGTGREGSGRVSANARRSVGRGEILYTSIIRATAAARSGDESRMDRTKGTLTTTTLAIRTEGDSFSSFVWRRTADGPEGSGDGRQRSHGATERSG